MNTNERNKSVTTPETTGDPGTVRTQNGDWSLWSVESLGTLLLTADDIGTLVQTVDLDTSTGTIVATSRSPSARVTLLLNDGGHTDEFEVALNSHLAVFGLERENAERIERTDMLPDRPLPSGPRM